MSIIIRLVAIAVIVILGVTVNYVWIPVWSFYSPEMWILLLVMFAVAAIIFAIAESIEDNVYVCTIICAAFAVISLLVWVCGSISSAKMFNASKYHNIVEIQEGNFEEEIEKVTEATKPIIVNVFTAKRLGDRTIGSIKNATWYEVDDEYNLIKYQGEFYRISELNYGGFWRFNKAKNEGIPGYVMVNATNQEAKFVELEECIRYSPSAHFSYKLERHLRWQYPSYMFGKSFFEIDEEGKGYYITSVKNATIGMFGGKKEESFIITYEKTKEPAEADSSVPRYAMLILEKN